jgi:hypothetical protein
LKASNKYQNLGYSSRQAIRRLDDLGIMINGSFVFGLDNDGPDVFERTVGWAVESGITTATFHIMTPYPGTALYARLEKEGRILTRNWDLYDTRHVVYACRNMEAPHLKQGYERAYDHFYRWKNIFRGSLNHHTTKHAVKHFFYTAGWKKFEPLWDLVIKTRQLNAMRPLLEAVLSKVTRNQQPASRSTHGAGTKSSFRLILCSYRSRLHRALCGGRPGNVLPAKVKRAGHRNQEIPHHDAFARRDDLTDVEPPAGCQDERRSDDSPRHLDPDSGAQPIHEGRVSVDAGHDKRPVDEQVGKADVREAVQHIEQ